MPVDTDPNARDAPAWSRRLAEAAIALAGLALALPLILIGG